MRNLLGQLSDTDIRLLRVFMVVVESGGLSAAEMELNIGRSTISRHLKDLETRLGMTLCRRGRAGFSLTSEGEHIYDSAQRLILSIEGFRHEVNDLHQTLKGRLVIAMFDTTVTNPECRVHEAIQAYSAIAPDVSIDIHVVPMNEIEKGVIDGKYHIGIIPPHRRSASLEYMPLFGETMHMYCGVGHRLYGRTSLIADEEMLAQQYAGLTFNSPNMEKGRQLGLVSHSAASNQEAIVTLIQSGRYIGFLPDHYADVLRANGKIQRLHNERFSYYCEFTSIVRKSPKPTRIVEGFLTALRNTREAILEEKPS